MKNTGSEGKAYGQRERKLLISRSLCGSMIFPAIAADFGLFSVGDFRSPVWNSEEAVNEAEISIHTFALPYICTLDCGGIVSLADGT